MRLAFFAASLALWSATAAAHKPSDAYLALDARVEPPTLELRVPVRDLDLALGLDANRDGAITWGEISAAEPAIAAWAFAGARATRDGRPCAAEAMPLLIDAQVGEAYAVLAARLACAGAGIYALRYDLLFDADPTHRAFARLAEAGGETSAVLDPARRTLGTAGEGGFLSYLRSGVWHIWIGYDHLAFLLLLLLPATLRRRAGDWQVAEAGRAVAWRAAAVVTAFTLAHSVTLSLAALGLVRMPVQLAEILIAVSVVGAGLLNVFPLRRVPGVALAFGFGLIHGFGFANVLAEFGLAAGGLLRSLLGFNLGVELGQLAVVAGVLPLLWLATRAEVYRRRVVPAGSLALAALAAVWVVERALGA